MDEDLKKLFESTAAETRRHFDVVAERLETKIGLVAEAVVGTNERIDRVEVRISGFEEKIEGLDVKVGVLDSKVGALGEQVAALDEKIDDLSANMAREFNDVRSMIKFSHHELDRRVRTLEETVSDLQTRVERLESSTH